MVESNDLPVTLRQAGKAASEDFPLFVTVTEIKRIGIIACQERWLNGPLGGAWTRRKRPRTTVKPRTLNLVQLTVPLCQIHSLRRGHLLVRDRATELDLQFVIELLDSLVLAS
jgi:hypothetical protein